MTTTDEYRATAARALAKCAANDPWFPQPNRATVEAWAEHIAQWQLGDADVLAGVTKMYADNGGGSGERFKPLPKDLIAAARAVRADRTQRETPAEREAREDRRDAELEANRGRLAEMIGGFGKAIPNA